MSQKVYEKTDSFLVVKRKLAIRVIGLLGGMLLLLGGCGGGITQYEITGNITYNGKPVPNGRIIFSPKAGPGGYGAQGVARIEDGKIISHDEKRVIGGSYGIRIMAFDGVPYTDGGGNTVPYGKELFGSQHAEVDLPQHDAAVNIDVTEEKGDYKVDVQVTPL